MCSCMGRVWPRVCCSGRERQGTHHLVVCCACQPTANFLVVCGPPDTNHGTDTIFVQPHKITFKEGKKSYNTSNKSTVTASLQAMAAYRTASRSFPGLHAPMLGMGMEYARMNNVLLAESIVLQAHRMCSADPVALHELGVLAYRQGRFQEAVSRFQAALEAAVPCTQRAGVGDEVMVNLGHAHRRLGQLQQAASWYTRALALCPHQSGTLAALGLTHHLQVRCAGLTTRVLNGWTTSSHQHVVFLTNTLYFPAIVSGLTACC